MPPGKVQDMTDYFRANFGGKWCETALILVRIDLVIFKVGCDSIHPFIMMMYQ